MKKRGIFLFVTAMFSLFVLTACATEKATEKTKYTTYTDPAMGVSIDLPEKELTSQTLAYNQMDFNVKSGEFTPKDGTTLVFQPEKSAVSLFNLQYYDENVWDAWIKDGHTADEITSIANSEEIGRKGGVVYVYAAPAPNETGMDNDTKEAYQRVLKMLPTIRQSIVLMVREAADTGIFPSFSTTDLTGNPVDSKSFEKYQLTMVNFWGTFCSPCIEELPDLETLSKNMPKGTRLVGVVTDVSGDENKQTAQQLISKTGVTYENWIPDSSLMEYMDSHITGVPTTLFINSKGEIVGEAVIGKRSIQKYKDELASRLNSLSAAAASSTAGTEKQSAEESSAVSTPEK
ncbi:TlpA family protein disulfide reductase [Faecalispora anaeroviscerum]|uniref:TlpA family protein disulfide reductase n=1 Tax=Faecalispora anaeroviscerum TaxID=2991836 RepID=UPI0024B99055|nr:TlpA disulfide reductase family protein [Faecalispora anaeroviscerum]